MRFGDQLVVVKGAGEMASGVAVRLYRAGIRRILMLEIPEPLAVRRLVSFCEAIYDGRQSVEGVEASLVRSPSEVPGILEAGAVAVAVDPQWEMIRLLKPDVVVDATLAKRNLGTHMREAPLVLALGPGFTAGQDAHCVVETQRGHDLGRIYLEGSAAPNTGVPGNIGGYTVERVLRAPCAGMVEQLVDLGALIKAGDLVGKVGSEPVFTAIDGVLRGFIRPGLHVPAGIKLGDVDPRGKPEYCRTVSEKARALGGAVLEVFCAWVPASH